LPQAIVLGEYAGVPQVLGAVTETCSVDQWVTIDTWVAKAVPVVGCTSMLPLWQLAPGASVPVQVPALTEKFAVSATLMAPIRVLPAALTVTDPQLAVWPTGVAGQLTFKG
jgi:hypothetical protein